MDVLDEGLLRFWKSLNDHGAVADLEGIVVPFPKYQPADR